MRVMRRRPPVDELDAWSVPGACLGSVLETDLVVEELGAAGVDRDLLLAPSCDSYEDQIFAVRSHRASVWSHPNWYCFKHFSAGPAAEPDRVRCELTRGKRREHPTRSTKAATSSRSADRSSVCCWHRDRSAASRTSQPMAEWAFLRRHCFQRPCGIGPMSSSHRVPSCELPRRAPTRYLPYIGLCGLPAASGSELGVIERPRSRPASSLACDRHRDLRRPWGAAVPTRRDATCAFDKADRQSPTANARRQAVNDGASRLQIPLNCLKRTTTRTPSTRSRRSGLASGCGRAQLLLDHGRLQFGRPHPIRRRHADQAVLRAPRNGRRRSPRWPADRRTDRVRTVSTAAASRSSRRRTTTFTRSSSRSRRAT